MCIYPIGATAGCVCAARYLQEKGIHMIDHPSPDITHLLLDVPAFRPDGKLRSGAELLPILSMLPGDITIIGGNLNLPLLDDYRKMDLLQNSRYLARNAAITADCALRLAGSHMLCTFAESTALVIGWGRIGKCLGRLLGQVGCRVLIAARSPDQRAMAEALGYGALDISEIPGYLPQVHLLFNTVPAPVLDTPIPEGCIALELASKSGIPRENVFFAGGLPGRLAPESSGKLIGETILEEVTL